MKKLLITLFLAIPLFGFSQTAIKCILKGEVIDRPESTTLYLAPDHTDYRVSDFVKIPIVNGKFEYTLECEFEELYDLVFEDEYNNSSWQQIYFFAENGEINFTLYDKDRGYLENIVDGSGVLNKKYVAFSKAQAKALAPLYDKRENLPNGGLTDEAFDLFKRFRDNDNEQLADSLRQIFRQLENENKHKTEEAKSIDEELEMAHDKMAHDTFEFVKVDKSVVGLSMFSQLFSYARFAGWDEYEVQELYEKSYTKKFAGHPTVQNLNSYIAGKAIKVGSKFVDFSLPDFEGNTHTLSQEMKGKVTLLDLWASWCGPCRRKSKEMVPIYEEYKDKGFVVVAVAREENKENGLKAIKQDGYQWLNLLELKDSQKIWVRYGVGNGGGATFLIDENGVILAVNPTADEVKSVLDERL